MKKIMLLVISLTSMNAFAVSMAEQKSFVNKFALSFTPDQSAPLCPTKTCAEVSIEKSGYVYSDCMKISNDAQDACAAASIEKSGYVYSDCLKLASGGACAAASIAKSGYIYSDCLKVKSYASDRCAKASIEKSGYVYSDCLKL